MELLTFLSLKKNLVSCSIIMEFVKCNKMKIHVYCINIFDDFLLQSERYSAREEFGGCRDKQLVGCFAAASRFNGVLQNDLEITALLHMHGALAFWDYSTAAPNCVINMNPEVSSSSLFMQNGNLSIKM